MHCVRDQSHTAMRHQRSCARSEPYGHAPSEVGHRLNMRHQMAPQTCRAAGVRGWLVAPSCRGRECAPMLVGFGCAWVQSRPPLASESHPSHRALPPKGGRHPRPQMPSVARSDARRSMSHGISTGSTCAWSHGRAQSMSIAQKIRGSHGFNRVSTCKQTPSTIAPRAKPTDREPTRNALQGPHRHEPRETRASTRCAVVGRRGSGRGGEMGDKWERRDKWR